MTVKIIKGLEVTQKAMERIMLGICLPNRVRNTIIRECTTMVDVGSRAAKLKWAWVGHLCRRCDGRWSKFALKWRPRLGKRSVGRALARWSDDIKLMPGRSGPERPQTD
jgi:hypothetical protein